VVTPWVLIAAGVAYTVIGAALIRSTLSRLEKESAATLRGSDVLDAEPAALIYVFVGLAVGPLVSLAGIVWLFVISF
jgi:hypothetical protein